eukprot:TRINITY_DN5529_c0_g2_i1.p1 TRINITY_DN5529_c0_g2~~TRINITY_DN5529_c0_g2_i1.p1  ORF type:complete len:322 (+),score=76.25 TRINITY_DN5529_c0_g2_i1:75-1040(+)
MHGRKKAPIDEATREANAKKAQIFKSLGEQCIEKRRAKEYSVEALKVSASLLERNPDFYTMWNFRREYFIELEESAPDTRAKAYQEDLSLTERALAKNPKSYNAWYHRKWLNDRYSTDCDWARELSLCNKLLDMDNRNFHCWGYRRFVVAKSLVSDQDEFQYTAKKIDQNFSNYSAWHQRSVLFPQLFRSDDPRLAEALNEEFSLVRKAFYTEPNDQSAWLYHRWLLGKACHLLPGAPGEKGISPALEQILRIEVDACRELLELEPESKWALLAVVNILDALKEGQEEMQEILEKLQLIDASHRAYYAHLSSKLIQSAATD